MTRGNPAPWLRKGRGYFVTIGGKQINLQTTDKQEAYHKWHEMMLTDTPDWEMGSDPLVVDLLALYCDWVERHLAPRTYVWYRNYLQNFAKFLPEGFCLSRLKPLVITRWLDSNPKWAVGSRRGAITAVKRALSWAEQEGAIERSPLRHLKRPAMPRRTTTLTKHQKELILASVAKDSFRDLLIAAEATGARPQELWRVEARHFNSKQGIWIFPQEEHKTGAKTGRPRVVYLTPQMVDLSRRLADMWPKGALFRSPKGKPWDSNIVRLRFKRLRNRFPEELPDNLCLYVYRHTFATDALEQGLNPITVAELLGHSDASMLSRVYQHLADRHDHMSEAVVRATS